MHAAKRSAQSRRQEEQGKAAKSEHRANLGAQSDIVGGKEKTRRKKNRARHKHASAAPQCQHCLQRVQSPSLYTRGSIQTVKITNKHKNQKSKPRILSHMWAGQRREVVLREMAYTHRTGCTEKKRKTLRNE